MTPSTAASLIREATRGWTSAELAQFYAEVKDLYSFQMSLELEEQYAEGHNHGYDAGYADAQGEAEAEAYRTHLERLGEIPR